VAADDRRPALHLTADRGWVNDPLAPTWDGERYHLFFQYVPDSVEWAPNCHWGHAVSDDLVHWEHCGVALAPDDEDDGVWSGSMVRHDGGYRIFYTAVSVDNLPMGRVRWADSPDLSPGSWVKGDVVVTAPLGADVTAFRDPFVYRDGAVWRMLVGTSIGGNQAAATSFSSPDLSVWTHEGLAAARPSARTEPLWTGTLWECPQLVAVGDTQALVASVWDDDVLHHVVAAVGTTEGSTFSPQSWQQLTFGPGYYAPAAFSDADGQPCLVFWIRGLLDQSAGRAGALSVVHRLDLADGLLRLRLHPALISSGREARAGANAAIAEPTDLTDGVLRLRSAEGTALTVSHRGGAVVVDVDSRTVSIPASPRGVQVLVDGPCIEVLTSGGAFAHALAGATWWDDRAQGADLRWLD
jgi:beta-fructofuranosidase